MIAGSALAGSLTAAVVAGTGSAAGHTQSTGLSVVEPGAAGAAAGG
ncbi:MAG: hypothetical protein HOW97_05300, partial [Catenulispora sp.]|nr:hypothetical protein [Catenulispora sp.]